MTPQQPEQPCGGSDHLPYQDVFEHLADELRRLDLLVRMRLVTMALQNASAPREAQLSRSVCVTGEEVAWLLDSAVPDDDAATAAAQEDTVLHELRAALHRLTAEIDARTERTNATGSVLPLPALGELFGLSRQELAAVVVCLAPELRRSYDRIYAYLQDDITRQRPSVDLVLELFWPSEHLRWAARRMFTETAPLLRYRILRTVDDPQSPSGSTGLSRFLTLDPRICQFLLGDSEPDAALIGRVRLDRPAPSRSWWPGRVSEPGPLMLAERWAAKRSSDRRPLVFHLHGPIASGPLEVARETSHRLNMPLLDLNLQDWGGPGPAVESAVRTALREGLLQGAAVHVAGADMLMREDAGPLLMALVEAIADFGRLVFLSGEAEWTGPQPFPGAVFQPFAVPLPDVSCRAAVWSQVLLDHTADAEAWAADLAVRFRLAPDRVSSAVERAANERLMEPEPRPLALADVYAACREQSRQRLGALAVRTQPRSRWEDLVLPEELIEQMREICGQVRHLDRVHSNWGFGTRLSRGKSLSVLLTGPPGTGKTMAAEVLAQELEVDLYTVDLSGVVSKYVGETEKHLSQIFGEAEAADAILFFDEADALYGKRTDVSNAHDRYANIETSYLLQRIEEYEGIVVLATNLRQNMDEAFTRRMRFVLDFPFPDADNRLRIWRTIFPPQAPVAPDVDLTLIAREYPVAGGSIKNIALNAAFLAAADGGPISRRHILRGVRREFEKIGKLWTEAEPALAGESENKEAAP
ncbi:ATP-binding protein [Streptomyces sp. NPDC006197]|uniref:ATP-binding protein n=1 Tax=Streptomyces sp. NPDC006197 TaxID=3156685 RepID=UPI0033A11880